MTAFVVLSGALLVFRALGMLGVARLATWRTAAAYAMAIMLVVTASAHFIPETVTVMPNHADLVRIVPPFVPMADAMVYLTGVLELLGAAGLVLTATRRAAGLCLGALYVALLPANVYAVVADVPYNGGEASPLWLRIPLQAIYITAALWASKTRPTL